MRRLLTIFVGLLLVASPVYAQSSAISHENITVSTTAVGLAAGTRATQGRTATACVFSVETDSIRLRYDGTDPTSSVGHQFASGGRFRLTGAENLAALRMIRSGSSDATVRVTCSASAPEAPLESLVGAGSSSTVAISQTGDENLVDVGVFPDNEPFNVAQWGGVAPAAAAASADAAANATLPPVGAFLSLFNGTTWDRARGDTTNGLDVDVTRMPADATELPAAVAVADNITPANSPTVIALMACYDSAGANWDRCISGDATHDSAVITTGPQGMLEAKDFDGSALPNAVNAEGDAVRTAGTLSGVPYGFLVNEDGSKQLGKLEDDAHATADYGLPVWGRRIDTLAASSGTSGDYEAFNMNEVGALWVSLRDPCTVKAKTYVNINQTANTELFAGTASNRTFFCEINLVTATAQNIALVSGTGTTCGTGTAGLAGGTTAATGWNFAANGGIQRGNGLGSLTKTGTDAHNVCLLQSGTGQVSGSIAYVTAANQ